MRHAISLSITALVTAVSLTSCRGDQKTAQNSGDTSATIHVAQLTIRSGTSIEVWLNTTLSSEKASIGDPWTGSVITGPDGIPAGSVVRGTVTGVRTALKGGRAMLDLGLTSISVGGYSTPARGTMEAVIAGILATSQGHQVVLRNGTPLTFTTTEAINVRQ